MFTSIARHRSPCKCVNTGDIHSYVVDGDCNCHIILNFGNIYGGSLKQAVDYRQKCGRMGVDLLFIVVIIWLGKERRVINKF